MLGTFEFSYRRAALQDGIADILSTYDDLIENNRRRMALLEEAARQLYREWFVRLRFPGHEHTRIINGVPEGWEDIGAPAMDVRWWPSKTTVPDYWDGDHSSSGPRGRTKRNLLRAHRQNGVSRSKARIAAAWLYEPDDRVQLGDGAVGAQPRSCSMAIEQSCYALIG